MESLKKVLDSHGTLNSVSVSDSVNYTVTTSESQVNLIADKLVTVLNNPSRRRYYCKVAWGLPERVIWNHLELAQTGRDPQKYFSWLCNRDLTKH